MSRNQPPTTTRIAGAKLSLRKWRQNLDWLGVCEDINRKQTWLCRLGWHRWKPVLRADWVRNYFLMRGRIASPIAHKCARCGKRRSV